MDVNEASFEEKVLRRSAEVPVVVDFWAEWCGPCRALGPVLEREVAALGGKVELAKVDTDANPRLAAQFQIRGIPAVKAFKDGRVVDEFVGAQPAPVVRQFLAQLAPSETQLASEKALAEAVRQLAAGHGDEIAPLLAQIDPRGPLADQAEALRRVLEFHQVGREYGGENKARGVLGANEDDLEARYALASAIAARGDLRGALEELLQIVTRSRKFRDDAGRRAMLTLFQQPGADEEIVREMRRRLQIVT